MTKNKGKFDKINIALIYFIRILLILAITLAIIGKNWISLFMSILAFGLSFLPVIIERKFNIDIPIEFESLIVLFIYSSLFLGEVGRFYVKIWWWDLILHFSSALSFGIIGFLILYVMDKSTKVKASPFWIAFFTFSFALSIGTFWEIYEFLMDLIFKTNMQKSGLIDTMSDLIVDFLASLIVSVFAYFYLKKKEKGIIGLIINRFKTHNPDLFHKK